VPLVSRVGGLADTVRDIAEHPNSGTGIVFPPTSAGLGEGLVRALKLFADKSAYTAVQQRGMAEDHSWQKAAQAYEQFYEDSL